MKLNSTFCFIDSGLKNLDKDLYQFLLGIIQKYQMIKVSELANYHKNHPILVVSREVNKLDIDNKLAIQVQIDQSNLDLFAMAGEVENKNLETDYFSVSDKEELENLISLIINDLYLKQKKFIFSKLKRNEKIQDMKQISKERVKFFNKHKSEIEEFYGEFFKFGTLDQNIASAMLKRFNGQYDLSLVEDSVNDSENERLELPLFWQEELLGNLYSSNQEALNFVHSLFMFFNYFHTIRETEASDLTQWRAVFDTLNFPIAIFTKHEDLLISNKKFSNLNILDRDIFKIKTNELLDIKGQYFRIQVEKLFSDFKVFLFYPADKMLQENETPSLEELGIVSSSIAHELNNPLGAILASIDVLLLEDKLNFETKERLEEMKKVVLRCKKLVATFLGFSKSQSALEKLHREKFDVEESIQQAIELIRFRLIESNIFMDIKTEQALVYSHPFNPHVLSMIFYLTFGDIATNFSHQNLVNESQAQCTSLLIQEKNDSIVIKGGEDLLLSQELLNSKLYLHLLELERLTLTCSNGTLKFSYL